MSNLTLAIASVETRKSATKGSYTYGKAAIQKKDGSTRDVTIMAFGDQRASIVRRLAKGRTLTLNCVFDGGVVKILGPERVAPANDEAVAG